MDYLHISVAAESLFKIGSFNLSNSFFVSLLVSAFLIVFSCWFKIGTKKTRKSGLYLLTFSFLAGLLGFFEKVAGKKAKQFFPLLASFFVFIAFSNWTGLLPGMGTIGFWQKEQGTKIFVPFLRGPTADINTTLALAIFSVAATQFFGMRNLGFAGYIKKYINLSNPLNFFVGLLEIVSELAKIMSFSFRLFGNIFAGEVLLMVMGAILPFLAPLPFLGLELFVGFIQALVFTMLSLVFMSVAITTHNNSHNNKKEVNYGHN